MMPIRLWHYFNQFRRNRVPGQLVIQMTDWCNALCPQCGMNTTQCFERHRLSLPQLKTAIDAAAARHIGWSRQKIYRRLAAHGLPVNVTESQLEALQGIVERLAAEVEGEVARIATGGLASTIVPHCRSVEIIDEFLTLDGLRLIYEMNCEPA